MTLKHISVAIALSIASQMNAQHIGALKVVGPKEADRFVTRIDAPAAPKGLDGKNIALWQSHGWYFEPKLNRWEWQRARIFQTVEDLYTQSYVMPYLMPMLENAGAYVMSPRERDVNTIEVIVDNDGHKAQDGYAEHNGSNKWHDFDGKGFAYKTETLTIDQNPFTEGTARQVQATDNEDKVSKATWTAEIPKDGDYAVYVSYKSLPNSAKDVTYTIKSARGEEEFDVNQQMGGGTWIYLGHFPLKKGRHEVVSLMNLSSDPEAVVTADAVKIGGGMGNVARKVIEPLDDIDYEYVLSGYPRFTEGARYWLQWAGMPKSVYTPSNNINDYTDDYRSRGEWVNYMAGGSSMLPNTPGLKIPIDLSFAFHTDAGTKMDDTIVGTLGIYFTDGGKSYANGTDRNASKVFTDMIMTKIVDDVRSQFEPNWTRRDMWDKSYYEARVPEVPSMLLELLSHQNFADMKYGLDPNFRFTVSRAIYKGMLQFLAERDGRDYVVQPLAVQAMAINQVNGKDYKLTWLPTVDSLESTAMPKGYIIEERIDDGAFKRVAQADTTEWTFTIADGKIHSFRVIAVNDGGQSFPSEVMAVCHKGDATPVVIVNGFTRVSAPDWFEAGNIAGFYDAKDSGVPYIKDISYIGPQFEFNRTLPWRDDDASGFGDSRSIYENKVIAGNTFDYCYTHGRSIADAGRGFISMSVQAYCANDSVKTDVVDLILGKQKETKVGLGHYGTRFKAFPAELKARLESHCSAGGDLLVTGSYIASDLCDNPYSGADVKKADEAFAKEVLGFNWRVGQASCEGRAYQVPCRFRQLTKGDYTFYNKPNIEGYAVESPDCFYPAEKSLCATFMRYTENNLIAGTAFDNGRWKVIAVGFPFESISEQGERNHLMRQALDFFNAESRPPMNKKASAATTNVKSSDAQVKKKK